MLFRSTDVRGFEVSKVCILKNPRGCKLRNGKNDEKRGSPGPKWRSRNPWSSATLGAFGPLLARFSTDLKSFSSVFSSVFFLDIFSHLLAGFPCRKPDENPCNLGLQSFQFSGKSRRLCCTELSIFSQKLKQGQTMSK